jgi:hypothetical protein
MNMNAVVVRMDEGGYSTCTQNGVERTELDEPCGESDQHEDTDAHERDSEFRSQRMKNARSFLLVVHPLVSKDAAEADIHEIARVQRLRGHVQDGHDPETDRQARDISS